MRTLKEFFADFFDRPATSNEARALAREAIDALKDREIELAELHGQKNLYPFLSVLDPIIATLKDVAGKNANWFLTDLARAENALLDTKESIIDPVRRFMHSPQRAIFEQARALVAEQEDNFAYLPQAQAEIAALRSLLANTRPWQGNRLQQLKPQLDALQQSITNQLASEKANASARLDELEQRLQAAAEYQQLQRAQQAQLTQAFADARAGLGTQQRIAMIRDALRRFEDERFAELLLQLEQLSRPAPAPAPTTVAPKGIAPPGTGTNHVAAEPTPTAPRVVPARSIRVAFARPWLASEADLDDYLAQQRAAWLQEIRAGNRVQI